MFAQYELVNEMENLRKFAIKLTHNVSDAEDLLQSTVLRALESAYSVKKKITGFQKTDIFIYPGYRFKVVDSLFTNFHLPKSTLLMLVSAFAGHSFIMAAYRHAVHEEYRFFSYGDAMFIEQRAHINDKEMVDK